MDATTGMCHTEVDIGYNIRQHHYCQSLRGDPRNAYRFSALVATYESSACCCLIFRC